MITRANVAAYLHAGFSAFATAAGQAATDDGATGYGPGIDNALRALGYTESQLSAAEVDESQRAAYFALADYHTARRLWRVLGARATSVSLGPASINYAGMVNAIKLIMDDAAAEMTLQGYAVGPGWSSGTLTLDWIDAEPTA